MSDELDKNRLSTVERRVNHLDETLNRVAQSQAATQATLDSVASAVDRIATTVNAPTHVNYIGIIGAIGTCIVLMAGFVQMRLVPGEATLHRHEQELGIVQSQLSDEAKIVYSNTMSLTHLKHENTQLWEELDAQEEVIAHLREQTAQAEVSRRAIGEYLKEVDQRGSRAWINNGSCKPPPGK